MKWALRLLSVGLLVLALICVGNLIYYLLPDWLWHPLGTATCKIDYKGARDAVRGCKGYNFWSGIAGSFIISLPGWVVAAILFFRRHECHVHTCHRPAWHPHPGHGHPVCKRHHPHNRTLHETKHEKRGPKFHELG